MAPAGAPLTEPSVADQSGRVPRALLIDASNVGDLRTGLADLEERLTALLADSQVLQHSLRLDSAHRLLRRGVAAVA